MVLGKIASDVVMFDVIMEFVQDKDYLSKVGWVKVLGRSLTLIFVISSITNNEQIHQKYLMPIGCLGKVPTSSYRYTEGIDVTSSCLKAFSSAVGTLPLPDYPLISIQKFQSSNCYAST
jgi:hypothetical protein